MKGRTILVFAALAVVAVSCGNDDDATGSRDQVTTRTVNVEMVDIAFQPTTLDVTRGETVRFVFKNTGEVAHDAFIGDRAAQAEHEQEMNADEGDMHHGDAATDAITVEAADTGELTYPFDDAGTFEIGCHQPGHYTAGMKVMLNVA